MRHPRIMAPLLALCSLTLGLSLLSSCGGTEPGEQGVSGHPPGKHLLVTVVDWSAVPADEDPYSPEELGTTECPDYAWFEEDGALEIDTNFCAHVTLVQPSLLKVHVGDEIRLSMYHQNLWALSPQGAPDADADDDGVADEDDAFPHDPHESRDTDGDGVGDGADAFPTDPLESADGDGDGVGDLSDPDDDDDGTPDAEDDDDDNDGVDDSEDAFPSDPLASVDTDGDGTGDEQDAFPSDPNEQGDADGDGIGDKEDAFPLDPEEFDDTDGDGVGDSNDNCPVFGNPDQEDRDDSGLGDACEAVVALRIGDMELFTKNLPIPHPASPITETVVAPEALPEGTPVTLHVRNHGTNTWYFYEVSIQTPDAPGSGP
ncbi:MAG: hypothetical protein VX938_03835 [Myxococcota bacterium]|nr:hypothetical protein [Myxococcota bacterium]